VFGLVQAGRFSDEAHARGSCLPVARSPPSEAGSGLEFSGTGSGFSIIQFLRHVTITNMTSTEARLGSKTVSRLSQAYFMSSESALKELLV